MTQSLSKVLLVILVFSILASCNLGSPPTIQQEVEIEPETLVMVNFEVKLPAPLPPGESLILSELDEVTGLSFNQVRHTMEASDSQTFKTLISLPINTVFKYRYFRQGEYTQPEYTLNNKPVRYRVFYAKEPAFVHDIVGQWIDRQMDIPTGRLFGTVFDSETGEPVPNMMVTAGGMVSWTSSEGTFQIQGLPAGTHTAVVTAPDGSYDFFQQDAVIAVDSATEATVFLGKRDFIEVTFNVQVPTNTPTFSSIRIAGNLAQLGNAFSDLRGGSTHTAVRLPVLNSTPDGRYKITLNLPAGADILYKYTLGDGIWNAEHDLNGNFVVRKITLPDHNVELKDHVLTWKDVSREPAVFALETPSTTPPDEKVTIQFNPGYSWLEPVPMESIGPNQWQYTLFSPLRGLEAIQYRYCRQALCGEADDFATQGNLSQGRSMDLTLLQPQASDRVDQWIWYEGKPTSAVVPNIEIPARSEDFIAGIEFTEGYHPSWFARFPSSVQDILDHQANWLILKPSWTYIDHNPPLLAPDSNHDIPATELTGMLNYALSQSIQTAIYPVANYPQSSDSWWNQSIRDFPWWVSWFDRYQEFINHHARIAEQTDTQVLILGDPSSHPALPDGELSDQNPSNVPEDSDTRWRNIITEARNRFSGKIWWAVDFANLKNLPDFIDQVDGLYILFHEPLSEEPQATLDQLFASTAKYLDEELLPVQQDYAKSVVLGIAYPSAVGGTTGCLPGLEEKCMDWRLLNQPNPELPNISLDLQSQENAYNAIFLAVKDRPWISGIISSGYFPPVPLQDKSNSIHGKPASGVIWFWYGRFLGK